MRQDSTTHVLWFLAGVGLGAAIGIVTAPKSGAETRRYLATTGREYAERGKELFEKGKQLADEASLLYDEGRRLIEEAEAAEA